MDRVTGIRLGVLRKKVEAEVKLKPEATLSSVVRDALRVYYGKDK